MYVEITKGWDGTEIERSPDMPDDEAASEWIRTKGPVYSRRYWPTWTMSYLGGGSSPGYNRVIVDFGSHLYFARVCGTDLGIRNAGHNHTKETKMTKKVKKPAAKKAAVKKTAAKKAVKKTVKKAVKK